MEMRRSTGFVVTEGARAVPIRGRRPGFTVNEALLGVVCLGVLLTAAIPRFVEARHRSYDAAAVADLNRATDLIAAHMRRHDGALPETARAAGFVPSAGVKITSWKIQTVGGVQSVHIHARHVSSPHHFHAHYPLEHAISALPWEW